MTLKIGGKELIQPIGLPGTIVPDRSQTYYCRACRRFDERLVLFLERFETGAKRRARSSAIVHPPDMEPIYLIENLPGVHQLASSSKPKNKDICRENHWSWTMQAKVDSELVEYLGRIC